MTEGKQENRLVSTSVDSNSFTIALDEHNSAFGISAETLRQLAASYNVTPEALITRAVTMWAQAVIPDLDLDSPSLTRADRASGPASANRRCTYKPTTTNTCRRF
jgi:hypothetical protein